MPRENWFAADGLAYTRRQERPWKKSKTTSDETTADYDVCKNCTRLVSKCSGTAECVAARRRDRKGAVHEEIYSGRCNQSG